MKHKNLATLCVVSISALMTVPSYGHSQDRERRYAERAEATAKRWSRERQLAEAARIKQVESPTVHVNGKTLTKRGHIGDSNSYLIDYRDATGGVWVAWRAAPGRSPVEVLACMTSDAANHFASASKHRKWQDAESWGISLGLAFRELCASIDRGEFFGGTADHQAVINLGLRLTTLSEELAATGFVNFGSQLSSSSRSWDPHTSARSASLYGVSDQQKKCITAITSALVDGNTGKYIAVGGCGLAVATGGVSIPVCIAGLGHALYSTGKNLLAAGKACKKNPNPGAASGPDPFFMTTELDSQNAAGERLERDIKAGRMYA